MNDEGPITFGEFVRWLRSDWRACIRLAILVTVVIACVAACVTVTVFGVAGWW